MRRPFPVLLAVLVLSACGVLGGKGEGRTNPVTAVFKDPLTTAQLKAALLTEKDLPPGFEVGSDDGEDGEEADDSSDKVTEGGPACARLWKELDLDSKAKVGEANISFEHDEYGFLHESIASYEGSKAKNDLAVIQLALEKCRTFKTNGDDMPFKVKPIPFPKLGDQTVALTATTKEPTLGLTFTIRCVLVRVDQSKVGLFTIFGDELKSQEFEKVARTAVQRVQAAS